MDWPKYMVTRPLAGGRVGYYWTGPSWAKAAGCTMGSIPLGTDYGAAKQKCDEVVNPQFLAWRGKGPEDATPVANPGTFDWMVSIYRQTTRYTELPDKTRRGYDRALREVSEFALKDGRPMGRIALASITGGIADKLFLKLKVNAKGEPRVRTGVLCMTCCKLAWNAAHREKPRLVPTDNPFANMLLKYEAEETRAVTHDELGRFVEAADAAGEASVGTAAMIAYYWLQPGRSTSWDGCRGATIDPAAGRSCASGTTRPGRRSTSRSTTPTVPSSGPS